MRFIGKNKNWVIIFCTIIGISCIPYMNNFLLWGHDIQFHLGRIEGLAMAIKNGDVLGRINSVNGYGYASGIMYPQLFLYIPALFRILGISLMNSYKLFVLMINVSTCLIAYVSVKHVLRIAENYIALMASAFYTLGLYRLTTLFLRAALGEVLGMTFLPLLLWGMYELFFGNEKKWYIAVIGWTCVLQSHVLTTEISLVFALLIFVIGIKKIWCKKRIIAICKAIVLTVLLNLFFVIPFLHYFIICDFQVFHMKNEVAQTAVYVSQMFSNVVHNSGSVMMLGTTAGEMPNTIGAISAGTLVIYILLRDNIRNRFGKISDYLFILTLVVLFAASHLCPWGILYRFPTINKLLGSIQFLFRLFAFATLFLYVIFAMNLCCIKKHVKEPVILFVAMFIIVQNCWYYLDSTMQTERVLSKEGTEAAVSVDGLYLYNDYALLEDLYSRETEIEILSQDSDVFVSEYVQKGSSVSFKVSGCEEKVDIEVPLYYYPTYKVQIDDRDLEIEQGNRGVLRIKNISQDGIVKIWFPEHPIWLVADAISGCILVGCIIVVVKRFVNKRKITCKGMADICR